MVELRKRAPTTENALNCIRSTIAEGHIEPSATCSILDSTESGSKVNELMISSECLRAASKPSLKSFLYMAKPGLSMPPMMSTYSFGMTIRAMQCQQAISKRRRAARATHHRKLEGRSLEAHIARAVGQHEAKVDVDEVTVAVNEDVAVVAVLDLKKVSRDRIACKRCDKVALSPLVLD